MFLRYNWPGIVWLMLILVITGIPGNYVPKGFHFLDWLGPDKIIHLIAFGILVYLLLKGFRKQFQFDFLRSYSAVFALLIGIIFGLFTEVMQKFVFTGRNANVYDFLANITGCLLGYLAFRIFNGNFNKKIRLFKN